MNAIRLASVEALEDRCLLATFYWAPWAGIVSNDLFDMNNWAERTASAVGPVSTPVTRPPTADDDLVIDSSRAKSITVQGAGAPPGPTTVNSLTIAKDFVGKMSLASDLRVKQSIKVEGGTIEGGIGVQLQLQPGALFEWYGGTLANLIVGVRAGSSAAVAEYGNMTLTRKVTDTDPQVSNAINWGPPETAVLSRPRAPSTTWDHISSGSTGQ